MPCLALLSSVPAPARWLGLAGVAPFAALAVAVWAVQPGHERLIGAVMLAYGATIASFLGAVHWGVVFDRFGGANGLGWRAAARLAWGVTPSLAAWVLLAGERVALVRSPEPAAYALLGLLVLLVACWLVDERQTEPAWWRPHYLPLRRVLTLGACSSLAVATAGLLLA